MMDLGGRQRGGGAASEWGVGSPEGVSFLHTLLILLYRLRTMAG